LDAGARYLDLLEQTLTHTAYSQLDIGRPGSNPVSRRILRALRSSGVVALRMTPNDAAIREVGRDWPVFAHTMVGVQRLHHARRCVETVLAEGVPGDLIEAGTWRGGVAMLMRATLDVHADGDRLVYLADSFAGLPPPRGQAYPADAGARWHREPLLSVSADEVRASFARLGLLDERVRFLEGLFADTLPTVADRTWAVVRLDADMYESTMDALRSLWPGLSPGGFLIIDDYGAVEACRQAVEDFRTEQDIRTPIERTDWTGAWWRRDAG
jgi:O-methyltransferase